MHSTATIDIAPAVPADVPTLSLALARAFHNDPVFTWIVANDADRSARLPAVFAAFAEVYLPHQQTYLAGDGAGAALWAPAGVDPFTGEPAEAFGEQVSEVLGDDADRAWELNALLDDHHPAQPCAYLQLMGVVPEQQGRKVGSQLLTTVLQRCDATGTPAYLEATSVDNRRLYARHGFDTVGEITPPQGPTLWAMWREPVATPA